MTLDQFGLLHRTDKSSKHHNYLHIYEKYFSEYKDKVFTLLEIGYGGYQFTDRGGESANMWLEYFSRASILTTDKFSKTNLPNNERFNFVQCEQDNEFLLPILIEKYKPTIVIDDASHINPLTIRTFEIIYPKLSAGSIYVIEDTHTSYWDAIATDGTDFKGSTDPKAFTVMNYFKSLADDIHTNDEIQSIHFYKGLIFVFK